MAFTTASLLFQESVMVAELYRGLRDWKAVRDRVITQNLLQARTANTSRRFYSEIASRLKTLYIEELTLLTEGTSHEQSQLLWIAVCRRYAFIADFAREVLRERYLSLKMTLQPEDFDIFFNQQAHWHDELDSIAEATRVKARQTVLKMMKEAGLITFDNTINPTVLSARVLDVVAAHRREDVLLFPVSMADLRLASVHLAEVRERA
ncbi:MAG: DUF1819 family protein [Cyanobacteria bacterium J06560_6]